MAVNSNAKAGMKNLGHHKTRTVLWWVGMLVMGGLSQVAEVQAAPKCYELSSQEQYLQAAYCFQRAARRIPKKTTDKFAKALRGSLLRNSAMSFLKASQQSKHLPVKAFRAEQTVKVIRWLLQENLCSDALHCTQLREEADKIESSIPYKRLRVAIPRGKRARIIIRGYQFQAIHNTNKPWIRKVRPGHYSIEYQYEQEKPRHHKVVVRSQLRQKRDLVSVVLPPPRWDLVSKNAKSLETSGSMLSVNQAKKQTLGQSSSALLSKDQPKHLNPSANTAKNSSMLAKQSKNQKLLQKKPKVAMAKREIPPLQPAPPVKKPSMVGPIVLLGVGGAAVAAGGILLGLGYSGAQQLQQDAQALRAQSVTRSQADQIAAAKTGQSAGALTEKYGSLETQTTTGWVVASSGAAMGVASMVWWLAQRNTIKKPDPQSQTILKIRSAH